MNALLLSLLLVGQIKFDSVPTIFQITHYTEDNRTETLLDTTTQWYWVQGGVAIYKNGCWTTYRRPRYGVIAIGKLIKGDTTDASN